MRLKIIKEKILVFLFFIFIYSIYFLFSLNFKTISTFNEHELLSLQNEIYNKEKIVITTFENSSEEIGEKIEESKIEESKIEDIRIQEKILHIKDKRYEFFGFITENNVKKVLFFTEENDLSSIKKISLDMILGDRLKLKEIGDLNLSFVDIFDNKDFLMKIENLDKYKIVGKGN